MSLELNKSLFEESTGRRDLILADDSFNWLWFMNQAIKWLDKTYPLKSNQRHYLFDTSDGQYYQRLNDVRAVYEVHLTNSSDGRIELEKKSLNWLKSKYASDFNSLDTGTPKYFAPVIMGLSQAQTVAESIGTTYEDYADYLTTETDINGLLFLAPADEVYTIDVFGSMKSPELTLTRADNVWTTNHGMIVALTCRLMLEKFYANSEGFNSTKRLIDDEIWGNLADEIAEEAYEYDQGRG